MPPLDTTSAVRSVRAVRPTAALSLSGSLLVLVSAACSVDTDPPADTELRTTHAVVTIERAESADGTSSKAEALAGFLNVPALVDAHSVLRLVGLGLDLPEPGACTLGTASVSETPLSETALVEFVDAGAVELEVSGARESLAPYAFPTVTDSISGVLYTSRDRAADPLPSGSRYTLTASGLQIRASHDAPRALSSVTLNGTPFAEVANIDTHNPLDLTWDVDAPGDIVYVELAASGSATRAICSFADELGAGTVPTEAFASATAGRVVVHRLRSREFEVLAGESSRGELRFDFAVAANVAFE